MEYLAFILAAVVIFIIVYRRHDTDALRHRTQHQQKERRKALIVEYLRHHPSITNNDVEAMFEVSDTTATNYLQDLVDEGKIHQIGEHGRGVNYSLHAR